jgi:hypothetical protein
MFKDQQFDHEQLKKISPKSDSDQVFPRDQDLETNDLFHDKDIGKLVVNRD